MEPRDFADLQAYLCSLHQRKSLRRIAQDDFGGRVNHAVIQRCINGVEPKDPEARMVLGLPELLLIPAWRDPKTGRYVRRSV